MKENKYDYESLIADGFSNKFAKYYISCINEEKKNKLYNPEYGEWALSKGFLPSSAYAYGLNENNYNQYLSDYDYYKIWPVNSWSRIWVDDKMTLKYMLDGTEFSDLMPKYYWYSTENGLRRTLDLKEKSDVQDFDYFIETLIKYKEFACKPNNGTGSVGFFKLEYKDNKIFFNKQEITKKELEEIINKNPNYIYTEYLHPEEWFEKVNPLIHTLRIVVINVDGINPRILGGYLRFGTKNHGETNHMNKNMDSKSNFDFVTRINFEDGKILDSKSVYWDHVEKTPNHPDSNVLIDYKIPNWDSIKNNILGISKRFFNIELMGFDVGITSKGIKIMEINTHPGIKYMQVFESLLGNDLNKKYFETKIKEKR